MERGRICVVTAGGPHPWILVDALADAFDEVSVVMELPESRRAFLTRRARKLGWLEVAGQFCTMLLIKAGKVLSRRRIQRTVTSQGLRTAPRPAQQVRHVPSVNAEEFVEIVAAEKPDLLFLVGCRIMAAGILRRMPCPVINYHAGITPRFRGVNGGYWALATGDAANFGATVHLVDEGVDTGKVLYQQRCRPAPGDTIMTYPYTLAAHSRMICVAAARDILSGRAQPVDTQGPSQQWYHPAIWTYLRIGLTKGVW